MSDGDELRADQVKVLSITDEKVERFGGRYTVTKVVFKIGTSAVEFPVEVARKFVSDENIVLVARHYLHIQAKRLADATASWALSDEDYQKIIGQKTPSSPAPGSIQLTV